MKLFLKATVFLTFIFLIGCEIIVLPSEEVMKSEAKDFVLPKMPEDGKAIVYIVRPTSSRNEVKFTVFIDDQENDSEMGYTQASQFIYFNLDPGEHLILSNAENLAHISVTAKPGDVLYIEQKISPGIYSARNSLASIPEYEAKHYLQYLTLGHISKLDK